MKNIDTVTKDYMKNPVVFADAFNKYLYHGRQVIRPENLRELDTTQVMVPYGSNGAAVPEQRYRDVVKLAMTDGKTAYCILGLENQSSINYAMPVRNMVYDAMQLAHQVTEAARTHRREARDRYDKYGDDGAGCDANTERDDRMASDICMECDDRIARAVCTERDSRMARDVCTERVALTSGEFLSGFYKTDRLLPVVTLVIYFGTDKWDGSMSLRDMYSRVDEAVIRYALDYRINLIAPNDMSDDELDEFKSSLREVMIFNKYAKDKDMLWKAMQGNNNFRRLDRQAAEVINVTSNLKIEYAENEEEIDMCVAVQEMIRDGEKHGEMKGIIMMCQEFDISLQDTISRIAEKFDLTYDEAERMARQYWK